MKLEFLLVLGEKTYYASLSVYHGFESFISGPHLTICLRVGIP